MAARPTAGGPRSVAAAGWGEASRRAVCLNRTEEAVAKHLFAFAAWRWGGLEFRSPFLKFSPNLQNSEPPSSESKGGCLISDIPRIHISNRAQTSIFQNPACTMQAGLWHTISVLPLKGEITDFPRSGRARRPAEPQGGFDETAAPRRVWGGTSRCVILWLIPDLLQLADELFLRRSDAVGSRGQ